MSTAEDLDLEMQTLVEPFRVKVVEKIRLLSRAEREQKLSEAFYSHVHLNSEDVFIDLVTDSGTGAMSDAQWSGMMRGDEAYMRSPSFFRFERAVNEIIPHYPHVIPTHQGRAAEHIMMGLLVKPGQLVLSNTHFDTTRAHVYYRQAKPVDLVGDSLWRFEEEQPFKGNFDLDKLKLALERYHERVPFVLITVVNNMACSSPVSMENIRQVAEIARHWKKPVYFDACRFSENAYFIKTREKGYADKSVKDIVREMFQYGEGCWVSAKKDANVNIGGFIALKDETLARQCKELLVLNEGFPTYGGLAGRDLEAMAVGMHEAVDESFLSHRTRQVKYLADLMHEAGIRVSLPAGGSGVFVDVESLYGHLPAEKYPGTAFLCDLYLEGGIRAGAAPFSLHTVELGTGEIVTKTFQFARFAIPRRVYTKSHFDYVGKVMRRLKEKAPHNKGYKRTYAPDSPLAAFFAKYAPLE
jgi:tryptophanase